MPPHYTPTSSILTYGSSSTVPVIPLGAATCAACHTAPFYLLLFCDGEHWRCRCAHACHHSIPPHTTVPPPALLALPPRLRTAPGGRAVCGGLVGRAADLHRALTFVNNRIFCGFHRCLLAFASPTPRGLLLPASYMPGAPPLRTVDRSFNLARFHFTIMPPCIARQPPISHHNTTLHHLLPLPAYLLLTTTTTCRPSVSSCKPTGMA